MTNRSHVWYIACMEACPRKTFAKNLAHVKHAIAESCSTAGYDPDAVTVMAVTKTRSIDEIKTALDCGISLIGENRVQELMGKSHDLPDEPKVHLIGHLQRNKVKKLIPQVSCIQSVDTLKLARKLQKECAEINTGIDIMLQVNTSGEVTKFGIESLDELKGVTEAVLRMPKLSLTGLMVIAPFSNNEKTIRKTFATCRNWRDELRAAFNLSGCTELSMGMTHDYTYAVMEGATMVRIGTGLFGERSYT